MEALITAKRAFNAAMGRYTGPMELCTTTTKLRPRTPGRCPGAMELHRV
jgi:hypothetical protein